MSGRSRSWLVLIAWMLVAFPAFAQAKPVTIRIKVIEATKTGPFDPKLESLRSALPGVESAKLLDELEAKVEPSGSVSLEILDKKQVLKVTVVDVEPNGTVKLKVDIEAFKFSANTTHLRDKATMVVGKKLDSGQRIFLAVTTRTE